MPRSLDPNSRLTMVLASDVDKDPQPQIFAKMPTINVQKKLISLLTNLKSESLDEQFEAILDMAAMCLTGWKHIDVEFSRDAIGDVLMLEEMIEIFGFLVSASMATGQDKKKSELQPS